jgi:hypothetical protein
VITARLVTDVQLLQEILTQPLAYQDVVQQLVATVTSLSADRREKFFDELGLLMSGASAPATREEVNETHVENRSSRRVRGDHK